MEKNTQGIVAVFALLSLLIGFTLGAVLMGEDTETIKEVEVVKFVNVSVEKLVEIPAPNQLDLAVEEFLLAVEDEEDEDGNELILETDEVEDYYFDEIEVRGIDDDYTVKYDGDETTVVFTIDLRFDDGDERDKLSYEVTVIFDEDDDDDNTVEAILLD